MGTKKFKSIFKKKTEKRKPEEVIPEMAVVEETMDIEAEEGSSAIQISFKSERGTGRGISRIPHSRLAEYITLLKGWAENPPAEESRDSDIISVAEATASVKDSILSHSWEYGKGKKPLRMKMSELEDYIAFLEECDNQIEAYIDGDGVEDELEDELEDDEDLEDELEDDE